VFFPRELSHKRNHGSSSRWFHHCHTWEVVLLGGWGSANGDIWVASCVGKFEDEQLRRSSCHSLADKHWKATKYNTISAPSVNVSSDYYFFIFLMTSDRSSAKSLWQPRQSRILAGFTFAAIPISLQIWIIDTGCDPALSAHLCWSASRVYSNL